MEITFTLNEIESVAKRLIKEAGHSRCLAFFAQMGVGKTTLINALCKELGVTDGTSSPTYSIINEYRTADDQRVVHMDWYRLKDEDDALNAGVEDYVQGDIYCFIEWPERAEKLLPQDSSRLKIKLNENGSRTLTMK